jgi:trehalose 6-phosphate synthase/phosphatase
MIIFHCFTYARHFLTCCRRILGLTHSQRPKGRMVVAFQGREVGVSASHVGVEPDFLLGKLRERLIATPDLDHLLADTRPRE